MSLTALHARARDGAYRPEVEAGLVLNCLALLSEDRRPVDLGALEEHLATVALDAPGAVPWVEEVRRLGEEDDPEARAMAATCAELVLCRDELRPDQWLHLIACLGSVWWMLERLEPFLVALSPAAPSAPSPP